MSDGQQRLEEVASELCEFVKCDGCGEVFDALAGNCCPSCGEPAPDPEDDFEEDPGLDLDDAIEEGYGDGCPFRGDVYADHRAASYQLIQVEKWDRFTKFIGSESAKAGLHTQMLAATKKLRGERLSRALDVWERAVNSWRDWDEEDMRRELQPWIDEAEQPAAPKVGFWKRLAGRLLG